MNLLHYEKFVDELDALIGSHKENLPPQYIVNALIAVASQIAFCHAPSIQMALDMMNECIEYAHKELAN